MKHRGKMKIMRRDFIVLWLCVCIWASIDSNAAEPVPYKFKMPDIPSFIMDAAAQKSYVGAHFWDNYDFKDAAFICSDSGHEIFCSYLYLLSQLPIKEAVDDMGSTMEKARADSTVCMEMFTGAEQMLYGPNSELRNETLYIEVLKKILSWEKLDENHKSRPRFQYNLALKNRPGEQATDFTYTFANEESGRLYDIKSDYVLLFFNNPGCTDCKRVKKLMEESTVINKWIAETRLKVLSVYPEEEVAEWRKAQGLMSTSWIVSYDKGTVIKLKNMYDLRAMPTLYVLDKDKRVILKDVRFEEVEGYFKHLDGLN